MQLIKIILILSTSSNIFCAEEERIIILESLAKIHIEHNRKFNEELKKIYGSEEIKNPEHIELENIPPFVWHTKTDIEPEIRE